MSVPPARSFVEYLSDVSPVWCPGCGYLSVLGAFVEAARLLGLDTEDLAIISGIGCSSRFPHFVRAYGLHGVHGRALPIAQGVKLANPHLTVVVTSGDGDGLAIGGGHLPHVIRNNVDLTYLLFNNAIYGLTKGQYSPTTAVVPSTTTSPYGIPGEPINPSRLALSYGATFVARGFTVKKEQLRDLIVEGIRHRGFSFIEILSSCSSFNTEDMNVAHLLRQVVEVEESHDRQDLMAAMRLVSVPERIYVGILRQVEQPTLVDQVEAMQKQAAGTERMTLQELLEPFR